MNNIKKNQCTHCLKIFTISSSVYRHQDKNCKVLQKSKKPEVTVNQNITKPTNECTHCHKKYASLSSLYRHQRMYCKTLKLSSSIINSQNKTSLNKQIINAIYKENKQTKIQRQIKSKPSPMIELVPFGQEDINKLTNADIVKICQSGYKYPEMITMLLHLNPKLPAYHNVYISNLRSKYGKIYRGLRPAITGLPYWEVIPTYDIVYEVIATNVKKIKEMINMKDIIKDNDSTITIKDNMYDLTKEHVDAFPKQDVLKRDINLVKLMLYSCANLIKKTKLLYEKYKT